ncbi:MAG: LamG domain-containing protein [Planctomycetota bacterium]
MGTDAKGYRGGVFDGRYIYFVPYENDTAKHSNVLRYDTSDTFDLSTSWDTYDPSEGSDGYSGGVFDGRYVYFVPLEDNTSFHTQILRYDTTGDFSTSTNWDSYDPGPTNDGYSGAVFDGKYIYFVPHQTAAATDHGEVVRYDTASSFNGSGEWSYFDPGWAGFDGQGFDPDGYSGAVFDGRYVHFVPRKLGISARGEVLQYDTTAAFTDLNSWAIFDPGATSVGLSDCGYQGAVFDGKYVYFVPFQRNVPPLSEVFHGQVLRYDTMADGTSYKLAFSQPGMDGSFSGGPFGITGMINTDLGFYRVSDNTTLSGADWHHVALAYDGSSLTLYVDGAVKKSISASGFIYSSTAPFKLGAIHRGRGYFEGDLDEVRIYDRALTAEELTAHYERRKFVDPGAEPVGSRVGGKVGP